jgi:myo-inositol 2-dehydrogenase / D-chiro-inositol 1-dehydrogenase
MKRRNFLQNTGIALGGGIIIPSIVPDTVFGKNAPSNRVTIGMIGFGRQTYHSNVKAFLDFEDVVVTAVCDVDSWRMERGREMIESHYARSSSNGKYKGCKTYRDFRDMIDDKSIDAVMISTVDHWHVPMSLLAVKAGKDVCCEKPLTLSIEEGRILADAVKKYKRVFRTDSEFRSIKGFHRMAELVRNGRIGKVHTIYTGVPKSDVTMEQQPEMTVPSELDYEMWTGPVYMEPYTMHRVHEPENLNSRPGWMRVRNTCEGLITNWGTHLNDIAQWCNGTDRTGPIEVEASGIYPSQENLWNVLLEMNATYKYANGVTLYYKMDRPFVRVIGEEGWIEYDYAKRRLTASSDSILKSEIKENEIRFPLKHEKRDFIDAIKKRGETLEDAEVGHRTCSMCQLAHISIQLGSKKLKWDPDKELFDIMEANVLKRRAIWRKPWSLESFI